MCNRPLQTLIVNREQVSNLSQESKGAVVEAHLQNEVALKYQISNMIDQYISTHLNFSLEASYVRWAGQCQSDILVLPHSARGPVPSNCLKKK